MADDTGKVWLVGAGPGAMGLLTVKGRQLLNEADLIVHDALISDELLCGLPESKLISVGKRAGRHSMTQSDINALLIEKARQGKRIVRLKGGDPFIFGRGGEELLALKKAGISYEVVPGVSSAFAVPAYAGIPVTHRGMSSLAHVITWHSEMHSNPKKETLEALARSGGTLIILMGAQSISDIGASLISAGYNEQTRVTIIVNGTTARQRKIPAALKELSSESLLKSVESPAIIVVGEVCGFGEILGWTRNLPLFGVRVVVTRPEQKNEALCEKIRSLGGEAVAFPCISTTPIAVDKSRLWKVKDYSWLVFTSAAGVEAFLDSYLYAGLDGRSLSGCRIAAIGAATGKELYERGLIADFVPETYDGKSLGTGLLKCMGNGEKALLIRAAEGSETLTKELDAAGAQYDELHVYRTEITPSGLAANIIREGRYDYIVFTSASAVKGFVKKVPEIDFQNVCAVCIGEPTARAANEFGINSTVSANATEDDICETLIKLRAERSE